MWKSNKDEEHAIQSGSDIFSKNSFIQNPKDNMPVLENPVVNMKIKIKNILKLPSTKKFVPVPSKCGLGKKQGTKGLFRGVYLDSFWEAAFLIFCTDIKKISCFRNTKDFFLYTDENGKPAKFYPDFLTSEWGYCEVKGIFRPNDILKKNATIGSVKFFGPVEMKKIIKEVYKFNPKWKEEYIEKAGGIKYGK